MRGVSGAAFRAGRCETMKDVSGRLAISAIMRQDQMFGRDKAFQSDVLEGESGRDVAQSTEGVYGSHLLLVVAAVLSTC